MFDISTVLSVLGIAITVFVAAWGAKKVMTKTRQSARTGDGSHVVQSGRDTNINGR